MKSSRQILIIAGPNGAGKTSFARNFLPEHERCLHFLNADLIAAGISPLAPHLAHMRAGKIMLALIREYVAKGQSFAFETTLSGRISARRIPQWQAQGFGVKLCYLRLPSPETAIARVRLRVLEQGHHVSDSIVRRRFHFGWYNFENVYRDLVDEWALYDNSGNLPTLIAQGRAG